MTGPNRAANAEFVAAANPQTVLALIAGIRERDTKIDYLCNYDRMDEFTPRRPGDD